MIALLTALTIQVAVAQNETGTSDISKRQEVALSPIKDGVYFSFNDLKNNSPSLTITQLVKSHDDDAGYTLSQWSRSDWFYLDEAGVKRKIEKNKMWGYVENGTPFILLNGKFHKFSTIGSIAIFTESYPGMAPSPAPVLTDVHTGSYKRLFDFSTGQIADFDADNLTMLLRKDQKLFDDFASLKTLKLKRKKMYKYVERFNEKYELFGY